MQKNLNELKYYLLSVIYFDIDFSACSEWVKYSDFEN